MIYHEPARRLCWPELQKQCKTFFMCWANPYQEETNLLLQVPKEIIDLMKEWVKAPPYVIDLRIIMIKSKFIVIIFVTSIFYSSVSAMELQEDPLMKWGRRIGGTISALIGGGILYYSVKNNLEQETPLFNKTNLIAGALVIGGLGSFTTKEFRIAQPVYHPDNGPEEDKEIAELVMSYKTYERSNARRTCINHLREIQETSRCHEEKPVEHNILVPLTLLHTIIQHKDVAQKANELYYNQQKPILARLPLIGAPIDGILYDPDHWLLLYDMTKNRFNISRLVIASCAWACIGAYQGIKKSFIQEKTPEDIEFEELICKDYVNVLAQYELDKIWHFMRYKVNFNESNQRKREIHPIGHLPAELLAIIFSYLTPDRCIVDKKTGIQHTIMQEDRLIRYILPYMGSIIKIQKEKSDNEYGVCTQSKVSPTCICIRLNDCQLLEKFIDEHYQKIISKKYGAPYTGLLFSHQRKIA